MTNYKRIQHAGVLIALLGGLSATNCMAQPPGPPTPPPPPPGGPPPPAPGPEGSAATVTGVVRNFNYGPGGLDGLILDRGTVIHFPPEYNDRIASVAPIGSSVMASGWSRVGPAGDTVFDANSITNSRSRSTVTVSAGILPSAPPPPPGGRGGRGGRGGPPPPPPPEVAAYAPAPPPPPVGAARFAPAPPTPLQSEPAAVITGTVRSFNYAPDGQVNGLILSDGTAVYFPPEFATQVTSMVSVSGRVKVAGWARIGPSGNRLMNAQTITNRGSGAAVTVNQPPSL